MTAVASMPLAASGAAHRPRGMTQPSRRLDPGHASLKQHKFIDAGYRSVASGILYADRRRPRFVHVCFTGSAGVPSRQRSGDRIYGSMGS